MIATTETAVDSRTFAERLALGNPARIVVFVPGFATSVGLAYRAARRIRSTLGSADRVVFVDWGSAGRRTLYEADALTARKNAPALALALTALKGFAPRREVDIFAHSLGTRVVAMAVPDFDTKASGIVSQVVFAAPDMTVGDYRKAIARVPGPVGRITLYVSRKDRALLLSEIVHLHRRLGQITHWRSAPASTEVVDASAASTGRDGHGYAINEPALIHDIGQTLAAAPEPHALWHRAQHGTVWVLSLPSQPARVPERCGWQPAGLKRFSLR